MRLSRERGLPSPKMHLARQDWVWPGAGEGGCNQESEGREKVVVPSAGGSGLPCMLASVWLWLCVNIAMPIRFTMNASERNKMQY